jgi:hypothetical protein
MKIERAVIGRFSANREPELAAYESPVHHRAPDYWLYVTPWGDEVRLARMADDLPTRGIWVIEGVIEETRTPSYYIEDYDWSGELVVERIDSPPEGWGWRFLRIVHNCPGKPSGAWCRPHHRAPIYQSIEEWERHGSPSC